MAWTEFINSSASTTRSDSVQENAFLQTIFVQNRIRSTPYWKLSHPFPDNTDSMILKSIKQFVIKIRVPVATLQNADRSTMSSASIQSQSPLFSVSSFMCQPRLSRMSIGRPCRLHQSRVEAHYLLLIRFQLQVSSNEA